MKKRTIFVNIAASVVFLGIFIEGSAITANNNRCDKKTLILSHTDCGSCSLNFNVNCPEGYVKVSNGSGIRDCRYTLKLITTSLLIPGCRHICMMDKPQPQCCPGYWGPDCLECPGGALTPCNSRGSCFDGIQGNGTCSCKKGFGGTTCETCARDHLYGADCSSVCDCVHGVCNNGINGDGICLCFSGYGGIRCDQSLPECEALQCKENFRCVSDSTGALACKCMPNYEEVGAKCEPINPCSKTVCDAAADCIYLGPNQHKCVCRDGYKGDGKICLPVDPCQENFGNCPAQSTLCKYDGPGKSHCECKEGYKDFRSGIGCQMVDVCATKNPCSKNANCTTVAPGRTECTCKQGYVGDGMVCYGNILERMKQLNTEPGQWQGKLSIAVSMFDAYSWPLSTMGPFTVLVPINKGIKGKDVTSLKANKENMLYFIKLHIIAGQLSADILNKTDIIYTLTGKSGDVTVLNSDNLFRIRIHGGKKKAKVLQENIIASNGILHIIDKTLDFVEPTLESNKKESIMKILQDNGRYNTFRMLLEKSNLGPVLEKDGPYTIFVPNNEPLSKMGNETLEYLLSKQGSRKLLELLRYHIITPAELDVANIISSNSIMTMANQLVQFNTTSNGRILVNGQNVEEVDVAAKNGRIYTLDGVLIPSSILPILPHRCDETRYEIQRGSCVSCTMSFYSICPKGSEHLSIFSTKCFRRTTVMDSDYSLLGCSRYCNATVKVPQCCKGFYGPDCIPCPGGFINPCSGNGECMDGITGNGTCVCEAAFSGSDCRRCFDSNKYGIRCDKKCPCVHGRCNNHVDSDGSCLPDSCLNGYAGKFCDKKTTPCGPLFTFCHAHADCEFSNGTPSCVCKPGYEGDGTFCKESNPCSTSSGQVCNVNAECIQTGPAQHKCVCRTGWTGDGLDCSEINNCLQANGGCHENASCVYIGPGQSDCECNKGFRGNGVECEPINVCLEEKNKCHFLASCQKMPSGFWECVCREGYEGDGTTCFGSVADVISSLPQASEFWKQIQDPSILSMLTQSPNVTVLVPSVQAFDNMNQQDKAYWTAKENAPALLKYHIISGVYRVQDLKNLSSSDLLATSLRSNYLKLSNENGSISIGGANFVVGDVVAKNGVVHLIDKVLTPLPLMASSVPDLMARLDQMPDYSIFRSYVNEYKLAEEIEAADSYTVFAPNNDAINEYIRSKSPATMDEDTMRYHIILGQQLLKNDLHNGMHRETMLGFSFQVGFLTQNDQVYVNDALVNYAEVATNKGVIHGVGKVLEIQKNRCDSNDTTISMSACSNCKSTPICPVNTQPVMSAKKACIYTEYTALKRYIYVGCQVKCSKTLITRDCCPGFFGQQCLTCPGKPGSPCFGNGICMDGINGTGVCQCEEGYNGTACETCIKGKYGTRCSQECTCVNGKCSDGINGDGTCDCDVGWKGVNCDTVIKDDKCNKTCHSSANCLVKEDGTGYCQCAAGFKGNGTFCSAIDACETSNGGCSVDAECRRTKPGSRMCICKEGYTGDGIVCLEIDPCMKNNGGCDKNAECTKTGPNKLACNCLQGYSGDGKTCTSINPCLTKNGGCSEFATCTHTGPAQKICRCKSKYIGDGITCNGNIYEEMRKNPEMSEFYFLLQANSLNDLIGPGPFTVFVPSTDTLKKDPRTKDWTAKGMIDQVLLYHIVHCAQLTKDDLKAMSTATSLQGEPLRITSSADSLILNGDAKIVSDGLVFTNGIVYTINKVLAPQKMQSFKKKQYGKVLDNLTMVAEAHGYGTMIQLIQDTDLMSLIDDPIHRPVTIFLPTDNTLRNLSKEQHDFLFNNENKDKLAQYLKYHIIRDEQISSSDLVNRESRKTLQGSELSIKCGENDPVANLLLDNRECKIVQRQLLFDGGVAYGIDCLLTPSSVGGRCDSLVSFEMMGNCGMCFNTPACPAGSKPKGSKAKCSYNLTSRRVIDGCRHECTMVVWMTKCCRGYYGRDCQACPGGPEKPCNNHGTCDDGFTGTGECKCFAEFNGTACDTCIPGRYGADCRSCDCTEHGQCDEGYRGTGQCLCESGWTGKRCETKLVLPPVCTPPCSSNAVCKENNMCECKQFYQGDGRTCQVVNRCQQKNGGCDTNAKCFQSGVKVSCSCLKGYKGDGKTCTAIDRCADGLNGGCDEHATCTMTGPDKRQCKCKDQYIGDGVNCELKKLPINRCMQDNGQCHPDADCNDLHFQDTHVGVFHLRSPKGQYKMTFDDATKACANEDATIATYNQLSYAQQSGYNLCSAGWLAEKRVGYPTTFPNPNCGSGHVGIVEYGPQDKLNNTWDVFCYRVKDVRCTCKPGYVGDGYTCNGNMLQVLMSFPNFSNFVSEILVYSNTSQKGKEFVNYLTNLSVQATLFAPGNDGLDENKTLSGRDIEYHLANVSTFFYNDLDNGTALQTRLGHKLMISMDNDLDGMRAQATKNKNRYVDGKMILQWDFFASNGIIHMISEPLKAPPPPQALHAGHGAGIFFAIVLLFGVVALVVYAYKKFNKRDFQFQQFNEYDDKQMVSELDIPPASNIANPMYDSCRDPASTSEPTSEPAFDPFSDSDEQQLVTIGGLKK
ncbi:stabilin-2 [Spea bombifrons]|uniref:stabilin-2 n=1 Tax=Spea bombifrons TaxID=233779 RepID=UPI0023492694|nr:stabilin-2 [Spea bombifrons]